MVFGDLIAWYLFFGGTAAGTFAVLAAVDLHAAFCRARASRSFAPLHRPPLARTRFAARRRIARMGYAASFVLLLTGMLCLLADLGRPDVFYLLFLFPTSSFVSIGAFALSLFGACSILVLAESVLTLAPVWEKVALVAKAVGLVLAVVVMVYTGLLLESVVAVEVWRSAWLPVLFLFSALSCGCGVVLLCVCFCRTSAGASSWVRKLSIADAAFVIFEALAAVAHAVSANVAHAGRPFDVLLMGDQAALFWVGFAGCGILAPLVIEAVSLVGRRTGGGNSAAVLGVLVLAGGLCLRFALVNAGVQTAV